MPAIAVKELDPTTFEVTVQDRSTTSHVVTVAPDYAARLTGGRATTAQLVRRSFDFLLEREPNTSILRSFNLEVINRYFPEYERAVMAEMAKQGA
ncbi:hypothetical protein GALL_384720 [mine drainage metagenome]|uniref:Uncharacterized protein n=1 Tax=mine drainage metagenome TaxID=410659 RepID=A0A1J5Q824_9ZZZZ